MRKSIIPYKDLEIELSREVYEPAEDTFLLARVLEKELRKEDIVLDMGTGTGILAIIASKRAKKVVGVDTNPHAIELAKRNAKRNRATNTEFLVSDLFQNVTGKYTLIVFNPPYLPHHPHEDTGTPIDLAWDGGPDGRRVIDSFLERFPEFLEPNGRVLMLESSLSSPQDTSRKLEQEGFRAEIVARQKLAWEELVVWRIRKRNTH